MTNSKEFRTRARMALKGKYGPAIAVTLIVMVIASVTGTITSIGRGEIFKIYSPLALTSCSVVSILLGIFVVAPITVGVNKYFIQNALGQAGVETMFDGFKTGYGNVVKIMFFMGIKVFLWSLLFVIPGIIKSYEYALIPYFLADDPTLDSKEAFLKSKAMMNGNKWRLFKLQFSFIGWGILAVLTAGVGFLFLEPYIEAAITQFYLEVKDAQ